MRRTTEQVHADGGHDETPVESCPLCQDESAGVDAPAVEVHTTEAAPDPLLTTEAPREPVRTTAGGCRVCGRPAYHRELCGAHYQTRRGATVKEARRA